MTDRFRVALGNFKKIVSVTHGTTSLTELCDAINLSFCKCPLFRKDEEYIIQYYSDEFDEFVDLDDISELTLHY